MTRRILSALFLTATLWVNAQEEKIVVIDRGARGRYKEPKENKLVDNEQVIKFSPLQMVMGEINLGYEKRINEMSSIEFEFGPTFSEVGFVVSDVHGTDPWGGIQNKSTRMGVFGSVGYRFYPMDNTMVLNRFYVSPVFKYRLYNNFVNDYSNVLDPAKGSINQGIFTFNFGYQKWLSDHFSLDFFGGLGLAFEQHRDYQMINVYDDVTGLYHSSWDEHNYSGVRFAFTGGIKVGIGQ
jgi:hypothetical protein